MCINVIISHGRISQFKIADNDSKNERSENL